MRLTKNILPFVVVFLMILISCKCRQKANIEIANISKLEGTWILHNIGNTQLSFKNLFPNNKPQLSIDVTNKKVQGNTGCNSFNGKVNIDIAKINFQGDMAMTKMRCLNENGENAFLMMLKKTQTWSMPNDSTLEFFNGESKLLKFRKK